MTVFKKSYRIFTNCVVSIILAIFDGILYPALSVIMQPVVLHFFFVLITLATICFGLDEFGNFLPSKGLF